MTVIYVVIGGFSWKYLIWLAQETVQLQVSDYSQLSDYDFAAKLVQNTAVYGPFTFDEIVMIVINMENS